MKWRYKIRCISCLRFVFVATWVLSAGVARAQNIPEIDMENDPGYKETQKFLAKTQSIIEKSRAETNAQAKDLEALANRVGELISNIGSTNEDASNLRSELSVQTDLLNIERETTEGLRRQMLILSKNMDTQKKNKTDIEAKLESVIASLGAENAEGIWLPILIIQHGWNQLLPRPLPWQIARGLSLITGMGLFYWSVMIIPLADATAVSFTSPLIVAALSLH